MTSLNSISAKIKYHEDMLKRKSKFIFFILKESYGIQLHTLKVDGRVRKKYNEFRVLLSKQIFFIYKINNGDDTK